MRYRVLDLPPKGVGAFTPLPSTNPTASSWGLVHTYGAPGTQPVPSPTPAFLPSLTAVGGVDSAQGHDVSPDFIAPSIYVSSTANMGPEKDTGIGMWIRRLNPLPIPALNLLRRPIVAQNTPRIGGRDTMVWPRAFQRYPASTCPMPR